jgi:exodeoxyribonuclease VII large subunit
MTLERNVLSVSELNRQADEMLRAGLGTVWVEGEVSNLKRYASGHQYFSLKDDQASVSCTLFRGSARQASPFTDGDRVVVAGRPGVYATRGQFQLIVERLEAAGEGRLLLEYQRLKARLLADGLFDADRKRPLPAMVHRLGVITSPQGDVRHDIERTLARRFPLLLPLRLYPVAVQGPTAAPQIVQALERAGREGAVDVLILARGGGSLEDLWAFNEETVARAIAACPIPIVTGIGHETDTTIADYVADLRASTPTAAAEAVSPDGGMLRRRLEQAALRMKQCLQGRIRELTQRVELTHGRLQRTHPGRRVEQHLQRVDEFQRRLERSTRLRSEQMQMRLGQLRHRLMQARPDRRIVAERGRVEQLKARMRREMHQQLQRDRGHLEAVQGRLRALDPDAVLQRGYGILLDASGQVIRAATPELVGAKIRGRVALGELELQVLDAIPGKPQAAAKQPRAAGSRRKARPASRP